MALVAKTYQGLEQVSDEFMQNGRQYVKVRLKSGAIKTVRAYTEAEYKRYNPEVKIIQPAKTIRETQGFGEPGYIWIFKGNTYEAKDWFKENGAKYNKIWGWAFANDKLPDVLPVNVEPIRLMWDDVSQEDGHLKSESEIKPIVDALIYDEGVSEYVGDIGDKIELDLTCDKAVTMDGYYGMSMFHVLHDACDNLFVWSTTAIALEEGKTYHVRGTVKDHRTYRNQKQTVLKNCRCAEI